MPSAREQTAVAARLVQANLSPLTTLPVSIFAFISLLRLLTLFLLIVGPDDLVACKIIGMPWKVEEGEIEEFLDGFKFVAGSVRIGALEGGRSTGQGCVLFESEDEAQRCMDEKEGEYIGPRFVHIRILEYKEFQSFMDDQLGCVSYLIGRILNEDNIGHFVKLRGMPREVTKETIKEFFGDIELDDDNIHIEMKSGRKTGVALVQCNNEDDRQKARDELNREYMGARYVDVLIPTMENDTVEGMNAKREAEANGC